MNYYLVPEETLKERGVSLPNSEIVLKSVTVGDVADWTYENTNSGDDGAEVIGETLASNSKEFYDKAQREDLSVQDLANLANAKNCGYTEVYSDQQNKEKYQVTIRDMVTRYEDRTYTIPDELVDEFKSTVEQAEAESMCKSWVSTKVSDFVEKHRLSTDDVEVVLDDVYKLVGAKIEIENDGILTTIMDDTEEE